jgi:hypothetical protein
MNSFLNSTTKICPPSWTSLLRRAPDSNHPNEPQPTPNPIDPKLQLPPKKKFLSQSIILTPKKKLKTDFQPNSSQEFLAPHSLPNRKIFLEQAFANFSKPIFGLEFAGPFATYKTGEKPVKILQKNLSTSRIQGHK